MKTRSRGRETIGERGGEVTIEKLKGKENEKDVLRGQAAA